MTFALDLRAFADKTGKRVNRVINKIIIDLGTSLVLKSPVGDAKYWTTAPPPGYVGGRFRANWQYNVGVIDRTTTEKVDPSGQTSINSIVGNVSKKSSGYIRYITNSLPYGDRLENGWSRQAPNGMVKLTLMEFQPIVQAAAKRFLNE